jgi:hypothetical protein
MDAVDRFAAEVRDFQQWLLHGNDAGGQAAREALLRLTRLYLAALELPPAWSNELADQPDAKGIGKGEYRAALIACERLPFNFYGEVFDPFAEPPESPVVGSLWDDLGDIYRDVATGLREYEAGRRARAVWEWSSNLQIHWGEHATGAIRASTVGLPRTRLIASRAGIDSISVSRAPRALMMLCGAREGIRLFRRQRFGGAVVEYALRPAPTSSLA